MNDIPLVDLTLQYKSIKREIEPALKSVLESAHFILGEEVLHFEEKYAQFCQTKYAVGLDSGLSALELGMRALGISSGDEVLTPVNSFIASSSSISFTGATPVFVDCEPNTYNIDLQQAEKKITKRTKAIMPVHLYGQPSDMDKVKTLAKRFGLYIIEDACQAHGATFRGKKVGSFGDFGAFSFYPGKNLGAYGDAGCLTTNNKKIYETVKMMRNYGQKEKYHHAFLAWNRRLDTIQAAVLLVKLRHLADWNRKRQKIAKQYLKFLSALPITLPKTAPNRTSVYHQFVIRTKNRDLVQKHLEARGIHTGLHYPIPIHLQPAYKTLGYSRGDFPVSESLASETLSLPMYPELTNAQIEYVCKAMKEVLS